MLGIQNVWISNGVENPNHSCKLVFKRWDERQNIPVFNNLTLMRGRSQMLTLSPFYVSSCITMYLYLSKNWKFVA